MICKNAYERLLFILIFFLLCRINGNCVPFENRVGRFYLVKLEMDANKNGK